MFICAATLILLPLSLAAPLVEHLAPIRRAVDVGGRNSNGGYIVAIKPNTVDPNSRLQWLNKVLKAQGVTLDDDANQSLKLKWSKDVFNGIAGTLSTEALNALRQQPEVAWIEEDIEMHTTALVQQVNAPWGLARLSSGLTPLANKDTNALDFQYTFDETSGGGTDAFILDTGCRVSHQEFAGRASCFPSNIPCADGNGHGTHVAGTIGGSVFGVAKNATLHCIKVMKDDGTGTTSDIISGINAASIEASRTTRPAVISMSLGGPPNISIDNAVSNVIRQGIPFIVAAGNDRQDANNVSPARLPQAITVGATTIDDTFAGFSNFGDKVDILAPGQEILSANNQSDTAVAMLSGTSMAAPHISGLALFLMGTVGKLSPSDLAQSLSGLTVPAVILGVVPGTTTALAFNGIQA